MITYLIISVASQFRYFIIVFLAIVIMVPILGRPKMGTTKLNIVFKVFFVKFQKIYIYHDTLPSNVLLFFFYELNYQTENVIYLDLGNSFANVSIEYRFINLLHR